MVQEDLQCNGLLFHNLGQGEEPSNICWVFLLRFKLFSRSGNTTLGRLLEGGHTQNMVSTYLLWALLHLDFQASVTLFSTCVTFLWPQCLSLFKSKESMLMEIL